MDFGSVGFDNLLCSNNGLASETDADVIKSRLYGSGFPKHQTANEDDLRAFKLPKTNSNSQMLCFNSPFPFYNAASDAVTRSAGYGMNWTNSSVRGPFSPSQWMELEHQALIYKYITANVPIPSYLLNPIRKALEASGFSCFSLLRPNALGWGGFHLGFSNSDPEPGRCRRTDGKKWRCSRDAVPDQKYCERHINRGRHRSRKPVEGQPGHPVSGTTTTTTVVLPEGGAPPHHQQTNAPPTGKRSVVEKEAATGAYSSFHSTGLKEKQQNGFKESSRQEFGLVCSDSLLNPLNSRSSFLNNDTKSSNVIRQFMDRTQLSISIPSTSPTNEKLTVSPLSLSLEGEPTRIGANSGQRQHNNWVPISSVGGPLGEALHTTSECKNSSSKALNLIENWDNSHTLMLPSLPAL